MLGLAAIGRGFELLQAETKKKMFTRYNFGMSLVTIMDLSFMITKTGSTFQICNAVAKVLHI
jgi:hypothetical protein